MFSPVQDATRESCFGHECNTIALFGENLIESSESRAVRDSVAFVRGSSAIIRFVSSLPRPVLGHSSVKITEKHYAPWVKGRQEQLEADVRRTWEGQQSDETAKPKPINPVRKT